MKNQTINVIGFIGLGVMGNSMSKNLLKNKKWSVIVKDLNQSKEEDLQNHGAIIASDIKEVFDKSDVIITCLPGGSYVNEMYFGKQDMISVIKPNKYIVDMSTSQPDLMVKLNFFIFPFCFIILFDFSSLPIGTSSFAIFGIFERIL